MQVIWKRKTWHFGLHSFIEGEILPEFREISLGWQKLGVDTRTSWVVGGGRILSHRDGQELVVRDFRRWREVQE